MERRPEKLFKYVSEIDKIDIMDQYWDKWNLFAVQVKGKVVQRMIDLGKISHPREMETFLEFATKEEPRKMIKHVLDGLKSSVCTVEMVVDVMMQSQFGSFGLAVTLIENYVDSEDRDRLLLDCKKRMSEANNIQSDENTKSAPSHETGNEYLGHYRVVSNLLTPLFEMQTTLQHWQQMDKQFYKYPEVLQGIEKSFRKLSQSSPVTTFPKQNLTTEVLSFLIENMSQLTNRDSNSIHVGQQLNLQPQSPRDWKKFLLQMGILARQKLWCKGLCKRSSMDRQSILRELSILSQLRHPNIVCLAGVLIAPDSVYVLIHMHGLGANLEDHLKNADEELGGLNYLQLIMGQVCSALEFMHLHQPYAIFHNNVKLANVLMDETCTIAKLGGFSSAIAGKPCESWSEPWEEQEVDLRAVGKVLEEFRNHFARLEPEAFDEEQYNELVSITDDISLPNSNLAEDYNIWTINRRLQDLSRQYSDNGFTYSE